MRIKIFNKNLLKKINPKKIIKKLGVLTFTGILTLNLFACSNKDIDTKHEYNNDSSNNNTEITIDINEHVLGLIDISEEYAYKYVGDGKDFSINDKNFIEYKDTDNAFTRPTSDLEDTKVSIDEDKNYEFLSFLNNYNVDIPYSDLFNLEHLMERRDQENKNIEHSYNFELKDGLIDSRSLFEQVKSNNNRYPITDAGYSTFSDSELLSICEILANTLNDSIKNNSYVNMNSLLCNLGNLKILSEKNISFARVTYDNTLLVSKDMIDDLQSQLGDSINAYSLTIIHEAEHLPQINCDDEIDKTKGYKVGFNEKWADEPINSLFWNWYYEASAETLMGNYSNSDNVVYENKTNYIKYLKMTMLPNPDFDITSIEEVSVSRSPQDFYDIFDADTKEKQLQLSKMMYVIELIQNENKDFGKLYIDYTDSSSTILSSQEWANVKRELKPSLAINLSKIFYENLVKYINAGNVSLNDIYRLITLYEAEIESHILYDSSMRFYANKTFMESYIEIQNAFFSSISTGLEYSYDEIMKGFNNYSLSNESNLGINSDSTAFLEDREVELTKHITTNISATYSALSKELNEEKALNLN